MEHETYPYETTESLFTVLKTKPNGDCIYLDNGCSIYENRPEMCRTYSCIGFYELAIKNEYTEVVMDDEFKKVVHEARIRNEN